MRAFENLIGQKNIINIFQKAIAAAQSGNLNSQEMTSTWLVVGPPGSGRTTIALEFAKGLLCSESGCGICESCLSVQANTHPDLEFFRRDGLTLKVDEIRELIGRASWEPAISKFRVIIIEDADRLTESAANALLKAIEEPGSRTIWLLCAPSTVDILPTIRSRCRIAVLQAPNQEEIKKMLIAEGVSAESADFAARVSLGHIGRARLLARDKDIRDFRNSFLKQAISINSVSDAYKCATWINEKIKEQSENLSAEQNKIEIEKLKEAWGENGRKLVSGGAKAVKELEAMQKARNTRLTRALIDQSLLDLISCYRDALILGVENQLINLELKNEINKIHNKFQPNEILGIIDQIMQTRDFLNRNAAPQLAIENLLVKLA